jgi:alpha-1,3-rhamnosyl/mannosyltransferase
MPGWGDNRLPRLADRLIANGQLQFVGYVTQQDLPMLYTGARVFAYPSVYEGFGIPPLEAMAAGTPVVTSDRASLPEVVGDAGICIPALDTPRWAEQLSELVEDTALRARLSAAGVQRARTFSWEQTARITLDAYRAVAAT